MKVVAILLTETPQGVDIAVQQPPLADAPPATPYEESLAKVVCDMLAVELVKAAQAAGAETKMLDFRPNRGN